MSDYLNGEEEARGGMGRRTGGRTGEDDSLAANQTQTKQHKTEKKGKSHDETHIFTRIQFYRAPHVLGVALGCTSMQDDRIKENLLIAAGCKVIVPAPRHKKQKLQALPAGKVPWSRKEKTGVKEEPFTCFRTPLNTGLRWGPTQFTLRAASLANKLANENLDAAERTRRHRMDLGGLGGGPWNGGIREGI